MKKHKRYKTDETGKDIKTTEQVERHEQPVSFPTGNGMTGATRDAQIKQANWGVKC